MKVFYLLFLSGLLAGPAYAEDDISAVAEQEDAVVETAAETEGAELGTAEEVTETKEVTESAEAAETAATIEPAEETETAAEEAAPAEKTETVAEEAALTEETETAAEEAAPAEETETVTEEAVPAEETTSTDKVDLLSSTAGETADEEKSKEQEEALPDDFKANLISCTPFTAIRMVEDSAENIEIIGMQEDGRCKVKLSVFGLFISAGELQLIETYEDIEKLAKNPEIGKLEYEDNYHYANLLSELSQCKTYQYIHHNGRSSVEYNSIKVTVMTDMMAQHKDDMCELTFVNEITADNKFMDYSVVCEVPDEQIEKLLEPHKDLIDLYGAKEIVNADGSVSSRTAVSNEKIRRVDAKLMYELQVAGYCHLKEAK